MQQPTFTPPPIPDPNPIPKPKPDPKPNPKQLASSLPTGWCAPPLPKQGGGGAKAEAEFSGRVRELEG